MTQVFVEQPVNYLHIIPRVYNNCPVPLMYDQFYLSSFHVILQWFIHNFPYSLCTSLCCLMFDVDGWFGLNRLLIIKNITY